MSALNLPLVLGPQAPQDVGDTLLHTEQQWVTRQRSVYKTLPDRALLKLARFPGLGRPRDDLHPGLRSYPIGQHVIHCRIEPGAIPIDRILHARKDATGYLREP